MLLLPLPLDRRLRQAEKQPEEELQRAVVAGVVDSMVGVVQLVAGRESLHWTAVVHKPAAVAEEVAAFPEHNWNTAAGQDTPVVEVAVAVDPSWSISKLGL